MLRTVFEKKNHLLLMNTVLLFFLNDYYRNIYRCLKNKKRSFSKSYFYYNLVKTMFKRSDKSKPDLILLSKKVKNLKIDEVYYRMLKIHLK